MKGSGILYVHHFGVTPEDELNVLVAVYRFVLDSRAKKRALAPQPPTTRKEKSNDSRHRKY